MSSPLEGVWAYIEVYDDSGDLSSTLYDLTKELGATVSRRWNKSVTHVVWRKGKKTTYAKAIQHGQILVAPSWIYACQKTGVLVEAADHRPPDQHFETSLKRKRSVGGTDRSKRFKSSMSSASKAPEVLPDLPPMFEPMSDLNSGLKIYPYNLGHDREFDFKETVKQLGQVELAESIAQCNVVVIDKEADTLEIAYAVAADIPIVKLAWARVCQLLKTWKDPLIFRLPYLTPHNLFALTSFASTLSDSSEVSICYNIVSRLGGSWTSLDDADLVISEETSSPKSVDKSWLISAVMRGVFKPNTE